MGLDCDVYIMPMCIVLLGCSDFDILPLMPDLEDMCCIDTGWQKSIDSSLLE